MRRIKILFFWLFVNRNNVSFAQLLHFLCKPRVHSIAQVYLDEIKKVNQDFKVTFKNFTGTLFWPAYFSIDRLNQVVTETFDQNDWHYYQKKNTQIEHGEILLDIGTAEGLFPLTVVEKCEHIYLIEPSKLFANCLKKSFSNYLDKTTIINCAVGNEDGNIFFDENSLDGAVSTTKNENEIKITKIDTIFSEQQKITYLKADIEGFEEEMLKGASETIKRNKPKIAITTYHTQNNPKQIIEFITQLVPEYNYYVAGIYEKTPKPVLIHFWI